MSLIIVNIFHCDFVSFWTTLGKKKSSPSENKKPRISAEERLRIQEEKVKQREALKEKIRQEKEQMREKLALEKAQAKEQMRIQKEEEKAARRELMKKVFEEEKEKRRKVRYW